MDQENLFLGMIPTSMLKDRSVVGKRRMENRRSHGLIIKLEGKTEYCTPEHSWMLGPGQILFVAKDASYEIREVEPGYSYVVNFESREPAGKQIFLLSAGSSAGEGALAERMYHCWQKQDIWGAMSGLYALLGKHLGSREPHYSSSRERQLLEPIRKKAHAVVDSSALSTAKLRGEILSLVEGGLRERAMTVTVQAFGFKYGLPMDADLVFDVRFLPNPHYIPELQPQTGLDPAVRDFVFSYDQTKAFVAKVEELLTITLPAYVEEGKSSLVIAVGCTGGKHRSVAIARELNRFIASLGYAADVSYRDLAR